MTRKHDRVLRRTVLRFGACMGRLPRLERRVLVLRAGVGIDHPRSSSEVAHLTGMRRTRVARLERRGLRQLRALGRAGPCAAASASAQLTLTGPQAGGTSSNGASASNGASPGAPRRPHAIADHRSADAQNRKAPSENSSLIPPLGQRAEGGGALGDLGYLLLAITLGVFSLGALVEVRRGQTPR